MASLSAPAAGGGTSRLADALSDEAQRKCKKPPEGGFFEAAAPLSLWR
ncbi:MULTISPECIES: hypothetical protein [Roseateles]|uniref:Uncharacterized protein n=1 Tax=Pelomonas aquatica TaxID=431058 RepID=A0ABU1Z9A8_9BURK|nr:MULTISPECIES: hypothetical protein [Roseateles]MDR7297199.1 hypothetical protein [Pelomonas aquatica]